MTRQATCKERIKEEFSSTIQSLRAVWQAYQNGKEDDCEEGNFLEYGLGFWYVAPGSFNNKRGWFTYQLSWGGPSSEFRFFTDENFQLERVEYWFLDWFDGHKRTMRKGHNFDLLSDIFEWFRDVGSVESEYQKAMED